MSTLNIKKHGLAYIAALAAIGAAISAYQTRLFYVTRSGFAEFKSICDIGSTFDCTAIEMSKFAELWPGFPLSGFALAGYLFIALTALLGHFEILKSHARKPLVLLTGVSVVFSIIYLAIMVGQFSKLCLFCLVVDAINILAFVVAIQMPKPEHDKVTLNFKILGGLGITSLAVAFLFSKALDPQAEIKQQDINDMVESIMATPAVTVNVPANAPAVGSPNAKITIVKFSDYQCPACLMGARAIHPLIKRYPNDVKIVFMNYPLDGSCNPKITHKMHEAACESARLAICAHQQGHFYKAYEALFDAQKDLASGKVLEIVSKVPGINAEQLKSCMDAPETVAQVRSDLEFGETLKIQSTPTFFINGKKIEGGLPTSLWIQVIDQLLKQ